MDESSGYSVGSQLQRSLDLLHQLYLDVEASADDLEERARVRQTVQALRRQPGLDTVPHTLVRVYQELTHTLASVRQTRRSLQACSVERLRDTVARLDEVSSTTETAAMQMLNGLDRTLAMIDQLERADDGGRLNHEMCESLRSEVNQLYGHLQFQDIVTQQLRGVGALLVEVEQRIDGLAGLFEPSVDGSDVAARRAARAGDGSFNADASMAPTGERQAVIDEAFRAARPGDASSSISLAAG